MQKCIFRSRKFPADSPVHNTCSFFPYTSVNRSRAAPFRNRKSFRPVDDAASNRNAITVERITRNRVVGVVVFFVGTVKNARFRTFAFISRFRCRQLERFTLLNTQQWIQYATSVVSRYYAISWRSRFSIRRGLRTRLRYKNASRSRMLRHDCPRVFADAKGFARHISVDRAASVHAVTVALFFALQYNTTFGQMREGFLTSG